MKIISIALTSMLFAASAFANDVTPNEATSTPAAKSNVSVPSEEAFGPARTDLSGMRLEVLTGGAVYVVNPEGYLQHIPSQAAYNRLFKSWDNVVRTDVSVLPIGPSLSAEATLIMGTWSRDVYLLSGGWKRPITEAAMNRYEFEWRNILVLPQYLVDSYATGPIWR